MANLKTSEKKTTDIICSQSQVFAMNEYGELYTWGLSEERQLENSLMEKRQKDLFHWLNKTMN